MAEPASALVVDVVLQDCKSVTCPYRYGDGINSQRLSNKITSKLKHRVSDGNEVKVLERRVKDLEVALSRVVELADKGRKMNPQDIATIRNVLKPKKVGR